MRKKILLTFDAIEYVNGASTPGMIMVIDFEAAFDTVQWNFLAEARGEYNFGPYLIKNDQHIVISI